MPATGEGCCPGRLRTSGNAELAVRVVPGTNRPEKVTRVSTGRLKPAGSRWEIVFSPLLTHPPEKVWQALVAPMSLRVWFPNEMHGDRSEGARLRFTFPGKGDQGAFEGQMRTWDRPRALAFRWGEDELRFELHPEADGTRLTLVDTVDDVTRAARDAAGWHECLDRLQAHLDGQTPAFAADERREQLHPVYIQEFTRHGPIGWQPRDPTVHPTSGRCPGSGWTRCATCSLARHPWRPTTSAGIPAAWWQSASRHCRRCSCSSKARRGWSATTTTSRGVAEAYAAKYDSHLTVRDGALHRDTAPTADSATHAVFAVTPATVSGFPGNGDVSAAGEDRRTPSAPPSGRSHRDLRALVDTAPRGKPWTCSLTS